MTFSSQSQKMIFTPIYYSFHNLQKITHKCSNKALPHSYQSALEILPFLMISESFYIQVGVSMNLMMYQPCSYKSSSNVKPLITHSKQFYSTFSGLIIALFFFCKSLFCIYMANSEQKIYQRRFMPIQNIHYQLHKSRDLYYSTSVGVGNDYIWIHVTQQNSCLTCDMV